MNKIVIVTVFIFWATFSFFYANSLVNKNLNPNNRQLTDNPRGANGESLGAVTSEVSKHNRPDDCWLLIDNKIYDVTEYINLHPGGANEIIQNCGQDATADFAGKGKTIPQEHSATAYALLANYYIGNTSDFSISAQANNTNLPDSPQVNPAPATTNSSTYSLTKETIAQHNNASDCWVTAGSNVYNVTGYIRSHPGGAQKIINYCGADLAAAFAAQGHSANATSILASYKIGVVGATINQQTVEAVQNSNNNPSNSNSGEYEDEQEDDD